MADYHHLYVISEGTDGPVKLGRSVNAFGRLDALQTGNSRRLRVVAIWEVSQEEIFEVENALLEELKDFSLIGEWFNLGENFTLEYLPDFFLSNGFEGRRLT